MTKKGNLTKAKYIEWQASLFGACFIAFGLGSIMTTYVQKYTLWIILLGVIMHAWGMYKTHQRNK